MLREPPGQARRDALARVASQRRPGHARLDLELQAEELSRLDWRVQPKP